MVARKLPSVEGQPRAVPGRAWVRSPRSTPLQTEDSAAPIPSPGQQPRCGQAAGSAPGRQAPHPRALICLAFPNKEICGREERRREGYRGGRPRGRMIQPPSPATRHGAKPGGEEEGTRLWLPQEPGWGVQRSCQG